MTIDFNCSNDYRLEDERVMLKPMQAEDYEHLLPFALAEPDLWRYSLQSAAGEEGMKAYVQHAVKARKKGKEYPYVVFDKATQQYAGSTRFYDLHVPHQYLQLGYTWYGKQFHGTGLNKHCKYLLLSFAFDVLNIERVEFRADALNERSIAAMKSIGCVPEGILRNHLPRHDGTRRNSIVLSIIKSEWQERVKAALKAKLG